MKKALALALLLAGSSPSAFPATGSADEGALLAILQDTAAPMPERCTACVRLRIVGTVEAVSALANWLTYDRLGHAARYALEGMPFPEAGAALRAALGRTHGPLRAGLVDSLGWRRDEAAVPLIVPLLREGDDAEADAAAAALGRIGTAEALAALRRARLEVPPERRHAVEQALLAIADRHRQAGKPGPAIALYRELAESGSAAPIRLAAWQGLVQADGAARPQRLLQALEGSDAARRQAALGLIRRLADPATLRACLNRWSAFDAPVQVALVETLLTTNLLELSAERRTALRRAVASPHASVRLAAWRSLDTLPDPALLGPLLHAAASADPLERKAAREALARLRGAQVVRELLRQLEGVHREEKRVVLLQVLGERGEAEAVPALVRHARKGPSSVRIAALIALSRLHPPEAFEPLLEILTTAREASVVEAARQALSAAAVALPDSTEADRRLTASWRKAGVETRHRLLPVVAAVGGHEGLRALLTAARGRDAGLALEALRLLAQWPTAEPAPALLGLAHLAADPTRRTLALRAAIGLAERLPKMKDRLDLLQEALLSAERPEEQKLALAQLARLFSEEALVLALTLLDEPALVDEAALAAVSIAELLAKQDPELAAEAAEAVLARCRQPALLRRAWALRGQSRPVAFLRHWQVAGPFRREGVEGAVALFDVPFPPEKGDQAVRWREAPAADILDLARLFPGQVHCVAYLRTEVVAPREIEGFLLAGSDDGIRVWIEGQSVLESNVDRGLVPDQDIVPIRLKAGVNRLLVKVTQGGGGWAACLRIVGKDGTPIPGLENRLPAPGDPVR